MSDSTQLHQQADSRVTYEPTLAQTLVLAPQPAAGTCGSKRVAAFMVFPAMILLLAGLNLQPRNYHRGWNIAGPVPTARLSTAAAPDVSGTWEGLFGGDSAVLTVTSVRGDSFSGILTVAGSRHQAFRVLVAGTANREMLIDETRVLAHPDWHRWALGTDEGTFSNDGLRVSGAGSDSAGQHYEWSFVHRTTRVVLP